MAVSDEISVIIISSIVSSVESRFCVLGVFSWENLSKSSRVMEERRGREKGKSEDGYGRESGESGSGSGSRTSGQEAEASCIAKVTDQWGTQIRKAQPKERSRQCVEKSPGGSLGRKNAYTWESIEQRIEWLMQSRTGLTHVRAARDVARESFTSCQQSPLT